MEGSIERCIKQSVAVVLVTYAGYDSARQISRIIYTTSSTRRVIRATAEERDDFMMTWFSSRSLTVRELVIHLLHRQEDAAVSHPFKQAVNLRLRQMSWTIRL